MPIHFLLELKSHKPPVSIKEHSCSPRTFRRCALLGNEQDVHLFERLVFMTRAKA